MIWLLMTALAAAADPTFAFLADLERQHAAPARHPGQAVVLSRKGRTLAASYDAAKTTEENTRHWRNADQLSADSANSLAVRQTLRSRARYECLEANSYGNGIVGTLANDLIGTGPRLQMLTPNAEFNRRFEQQFMAWARAIRLGRKLWTMRITKAIDGEAFALFTTNRRLPTQVQLDLKPFEADRVTTPWPDYLDPRWIDGIILDDADEPLIYHVLKGHPGDQLHWVDPFDYDEVPAREVVHLFRRLRPGQHRGVPEVTTSLPLFAQLRRYTLAVITAAEVAADFAGVVKTQSGAISDDQNYDPEVEPYDYVDIDRGMFATLPFGWEMQQLRAEQPTQTYEMFKREILNEIARPLQMPRNVAAADSSDYNYSSGRLDHQTYDMALRVERGTIWEPDCLDRILEHYFDEAVLLGLVPAGVGAFAELPHQWFWDSRGHVDPQKEAQGQKTRVEGGMSHRAREYALIGADVDEEDEKAAASYGVTVEQYRQALFRAHFTDSISVAERGDPAGDTDEDTDENEHDDQDGQEDGTDADESEETTRAAA